MPQVNIRLDDKHHEALVKLTGQRMMQTGKNVSVSTILHELIVPALDELIMPKQETVKDAFEDIKL